MEASKNAVMPAPTGKSLHRLLVIPAEAGIQDLHGIARFARDYINSTGFPPFAGMTA
jgi:hypothetical protein